MKVMVVDDNAEMRKMICRVIGEDVTICECENGAEACAVYAEQLPDWVLIDLMMPRVNGITATRRIKSMFPAAQIIILTSHESRAMRKAAEQAGAFAYFLKENLLDLREMISQNACINRMSK